MVSYIWRKSHLKSGQMINFRPSRPGYFPKFSRNVFADDFFDLNIYE